jgi:hypothetical protein|nr:MAG TPA: hypothetical protein [Caudoviricetes sp.]
MEKDIYIVFIDKGGNDVIVGGVFFSEALAKDMVSKQIKDDSVLDCWYDNYKMNKNTIINLWEE